MAQIRMYNFVTADGFYAGPNGEIDWFTDERLEIDGVQDIEHTRPTSLNTLVFGRTTYEKMKEYWPTEEALQEDPLTTHKMRESPKIVFSTTMQGPDESPTWKNVTVLNSFDPEYFRNLKETTSQNMTILGSGTVVRQFFEAGLLDEIELMKIPVSLSSGKLLFTPAEIATFKPTERKAYQNGIYSQIYVRNV